MFRVIVLLSSQSASDYGLIDAPLQWWKCFTTCLTELGMRQSELDPCCFRLDTITIMSGMVFWLYMLTTWFWGVTCFHGEHCQKDAREVSLQTLDHTKR